MGRIRSIKPEFWCSGQIVECSTTARLLFIGMWNFCDDGGNIPYHPKQIKMQVFPGDTFDVDFVVGLLNELVKNGLIVKYVVDKEYVHVTGWHHQKIDKPSYKYPKFDDHSTTIPLPIGDDIPAEGIGEDSIGIDSIKEKEYKKKIEELERVVLELKSKPKKEKKQPKIPTFDLVEAFFLSEGYTTEHAKLVFKYYEDGGWHDINGKPVLNWKQKMRGNWMKDEGKKQADTSIGDMGAKYAE